jgi:hypothetical protein
LLKPVGRSGRDLLLRPLLFFLVIWVSVHRLGVAQTSSPTTTSGVPTIRDSHTTAVKAGTPGGNAPLTIFVIDRLNSSFDDFAYIRDQLRRYLKAQPKRLN